MAKKKTNPEHVYAEDILQDVLKLIRSDIAKYTARAEERKATLSNADQKIVTEYGRTLSIISKTQDDTDAVKKARKITPDQAKEVLHKLATQAGYSKEKK